MIPQVAPPRRILLIRLTALGDVLLATPLLRALKAAWPESEIDWLVHAPLRALLEANPNLTRLHVTGQEKLLRTLRSLHYDLVIDLQNKPKTALLAALLNAGGRRSLKKRNLPQSFWALIGMERPVRSPHAVDLNLSIAAELGVPDRGRALDLWVPPAASVEAAPLLQGKPSLLWGLAPGNRWNTKRWPLKHYVALGREAARRGARILLLGGASDGPLLDGLRAELGEVVCADTRALSVGGLAAAIAACDLVVSNDSGPAHIAAALQRPVYVLFGPTSPERWAPPGSVAISLQLACSPCSNHGSQRCPIGTHACLRDLTPERVLDAMAGDDFGRAARRPDPR